MYNIQNITPYNQGSPGSPNYGGGGGSLIGARSIKDARMMMQGGQVPQAQYPDGYLGTIQSRREDRVLNSLQSRLTQRSYQRGVHKGERIDLADYRWNVDVHPMAAIEAQAEGRKWTQVGSTASERLASIGRTGMRSEEELAALANKYGHDLPTQSVSNARASRLRSLAPSWR